MLQILENIKKSRNVDVAIRNCETYKARKQASD